MQVVILKLGLCYEFIDVFGDFAAKKELAISTILKPNLPDSSTTRLSTS